MRSLAKQKIERPPFGLFETDIKDLTGYRELIPFGLPPSSSWSSGSTAAGDTVSIRPTAHLHQRRESRTRNHGVGVL